VTVLDFLVNLGLGFGVATMPINLLYCFAGVLLGTLIGVLPGIGPIATIAMLLPITFGLPPTTALVMLAGIYYGAQYGGSTTAILMNLPGESTSAVTTLDGYQMAKQGRAGVALGIAAIGSFLGGCVATLVLGLFAPPLAGLALNFGPPEYFALMVLGLISAVVLASGSLVKAIGMILLGLLFGAVGTDLNTGFLRFSFGIGEISNGIDFVVVAIGIFAFTEILLNLERTETQRSFTQNVKGIWPSWLDIKQAFPAILRGTGLGTVLGVLPGGGALLASFAAYALEKKISRHPETFGKGAIEGVAGPETANNAAAQTSFIPLLTLGIPSNAVMAVMAGALIIQGITPGPQVISSHPELFWGIIASMLIGNLMLVILNMPLIGLWVKLLSIPYRMLYPAILLFCCVGAFSISNSPVAVLLTVFFGLVGYVCLKVGCEPAPLVLGFVLGPLFEENLRRSLLLSRGDPIIFIQRPISATLLAITVIMLIVVLAPAIRRGREEVLHKE